MKGKERKRNSGYRPKKENREEIHALRVKLGGLKGKDWAKARMVMQDITGILGHAGGPSGAFVAPRTCSYCDYFGHTRQSCQKRIADTILRGKAETDTMLRYERDWLARNVTKREDPVRDGWFKWSDRRYEALVACGWRCEKRVASCAEELIPCAACAGCMKLKAYTATWDEQNTEPQWDAPQTQELAQRYDW